MDEAETTQIINGIDTHQLALDILQAQNDDEVLDALKKHGLYDSSKCPVCVRMMEAKFATLE